MNMKMYAALAVLLLAGIALDAQANFVPGQGPHGRNPRASMSFNQPWGFVTNMPRSTMHKDGQAHPPFAYSINKYASPFGNWPHALDDGGTVDTNVFNYLMEDTYRGNPAVMEWTTSPALGAGALRLATSLDTNSTPASTSDALSYNMLPAVLRNQSFFPASARASVVLRVYVPDPSTWQPDGLYDLLFMSMVDDGAGGPWGADWPAIWCQTTNGTDYSWACDVGSGGSFWENDYTVYPHMKITGPGWWTVGVSLDEDGGVNFYVRSGVVTLSAGDFCGTYRPVVFTRCYGLFGTFYVRNTSTTMSPYWIVDDVNYYHVVPPLGAVILLE